MDKNYLQRIKDIEIPRLKLKLKEIEKIHGVNSERWHIAKANLLDHEYLLKHGVPRNVNQSIEIPYDLIEGF